MENRHIQSYRDLKMWQKAKNFAVDIYKTTEKFPKEELYGITSQLRRASVSIPSNIAEGFRRKFPREKVQFLRMAYGSGAEIDTQLTIARELNYLEGARYDALSRELTEIMKIINVVINKLQ